MPTTTYVNTTIAANTLGARTDSGGGAVADLTAEESRLATAAFSAGYLKPANSFVVRPQTTPNMTVRVGSGNAKDDHYLVAGTLAGQGNYLLRLDVATQNITISAAEPSQARTDEIYLVVRDTAYDSSTLVLPQLAYRKGDAGGPLPGPDTSWRAYALLARVPVAAAATSISSVSDVRNSAGVSDGLFTSLRQTLISRPGVIYGGDLLVGDGTGTGVKRLGAPAAPGWTLRPNSSGSDLTWSNLGVPQHRFMQSNEGNNTTSFANVGNLNGYDPVAGASAPFVFNPEPGSRYIVEYYLIVDSSDDGASGRTKFYFGLGNIALFKYSLVAPSFGQNAAYEGVIDYRSLGTDSGDGFQYVTGAGDNNTDGVRIQATLKVNNGSFGTCGIQYAAYSGGSVSYIGEGSWMRYTRIA